MLLPNQPNQPNQQTIKHWCWELQQYGYGPDWRLNAAIQPSQPSQPLLLEQIAHKHMPSAVFHYSEDDLYCYEHQRVCRQQTYIDNYTFQKIEQMTEQRENIWIYNQITIHQDLLVIERGYAGWPDPYNEIETAWLLAIVSSPEVELEQWSILGYGDGYDSKIARVGRGLADLQSYLGIP
jgi:hypothetical protein